MGRTPAPADAPGASAREQDACSEFHAIVRRPRDMPGTAGGWAFLPIPKAASETLPRRGRTTVDGRINGTAFRATLEPDGQLGHWLQLEDALLREASVDYGDEVTMRIQPVDPEPESTTPGDLTQALDNAPDARAHWEATTTLARLDWIHWIESAKQARTRARRVADASAMLAAGKRRVCCFDVSGHYSKAFRLPDEAE